jgi:flagellar basal body P-ring protein FlgI
MIVGVEETEELSSVISVYPNPANDRIRVQSRHPLMRNTRIELISSTGQLVFSKQTGDIPMGRTITIETSQFAEGTYTLRLVSDEVSEAQSVLITR